MISPEINDYPDEEVNKSFAIIIDNICLASKRTAR